MPKKTVNSIRPRLRINLGDEIALGPGKVELLTGVRETGSITSAAARLGMSYMRAWTLIRTMNRCFKTPLVTATRGGLKGGGGAELTETGHKVLDLYQRMNEKTLVAVKRDWQEVQKLLRAP
jgi:molybdate transport system regulatory protein